MIPNSEDTYVFRSESEWKCIYEELMLFISVNELSVLEWVALWFDNVHVCVACPYCDEAHLHGSCGGHHWVGYRTPHCRYSKDFPDYYVARSVNTVDKRPAYSREVFV